MAEKTAQWAIMDRETLFALTGKYSIPLFHQIASLVENEHKSSQTFSVQELRAHLALTEGKLASFSNLNKSAIKPAIAEINQLSRLTLTTTPHKIGRTMASVEIAWEDKKPDQIREVKRELDRPKVGRKARLKEARLKKRSDVLIPPFPASGGLSKTATLDAHWRALFENNVTRIQGSNKLPDSKLVCDAFRKSRGDKLDDTTTVRHFVDFCVTWHDQS